MGKKLARDPSAPKRNLSAYLLYQNAMRNDFKAANPGMTFGQLSKYTSAMYAELTPHDKELWQQRAEDDKARYLQELSTYTPPAGYDSRGEPVMNQMSHMAPMNGGKKAKSRDPNAPKRNLSAYLLYQNAMRDQFKSENPGMTFGQLAKYTSHMYRSLTATEKAVWETRSQDDKARFIEEMSRYIPTPGFDSQGNLIESVNLVSRKQKKPRDPNAPKRARGSYVFFTFDERPKIMSQFPNIKFVEMGAIMGERWRNIAPEEKARYEALANEDRDRFNREMEVYNASKMEANASAGLAIPQHAAYQTMPPQAYMDASHVHHYNPNYQYA